MLVMSGDITFQARKEGYADAKLVLDGLVAKGLLDRKNIVLCPGNHDLNSQDRNSNWFGEFDAFSTAIRADKNCTFSDGSAKSFQIADLEFLVINSSFNGQYQYGLCDIESVRNKLQILGAPSKKRVCVVHHNLLNRFEEDTSTLRNAYALLESLEEKGFVLILHGHQHADLGMQLGSDRLVISGIGSLNFLVPAYVNGFAAFEISEKQVTRRRYVLTDDRATIFEEVGIAKIFEIKS